MFSHRSTFFANFMEEQLRDLRPNPDIEEACLKILNDICDNWYQ